MRKLTATATPSRRSVVLVATAAVGLAAHAYGQSFPTPVSWVGATGDFNTGANWSSGSTPSTAANEFLMINNGGTAQVTADGQGAFLVLGTQTGDSGSLTITGGILTLGELRVGGRDKLFTGDIGNPTTPNAGGTGAVTQTGGTVNIGIPGSTGTEAYANSLYIGNGGLDTTNSAVGSYSISNAAILNVGVLANNQISVGFGLGSHATFSQSGTSAVSSGGNVHVGRHGGTGTYLMSGGTLTTGTVAPSGTLSQAGDLYIGNGDDNATISGTLGSFVQTGGTVNSKLTTVVGRDRGTGFYSITGGSLTAQTNLNVGVGGTGTFVQGDLLTHPNVPVVSKLSMTVGLTGTSQTGTGTYTLNSGTLNVGSTVNDVMAIGNGAGSGGSFVQKAGTSVTVSGNINLGRNNSATNNLYDMQGGSLTVARDVVIAGGNTSGVTVTGAIGTFSLSGASSLSVGQDLLVGGNNGQAAGTGTFTQSGTSSVSITRNLNVGIGSSGSATNGTYVLSGGTISLSAAGAVIAVGNNGTGTLTQTGGTITNTGATAVLDVGRVGTNTGIGTYSLSGTGVLNTTALRTNSNATNQINFSGGSSTIGALTLGAGSMTVSGGTHTVSGVVTLGTSTLAITGGTFTFGTGLTASSGGTLRTSINQTVPSAISLGSFTAQVDANTLSLSGAITTPSGTRTLTKTGAGTLVLSGPWTTSATNTAVLAANAGTTNVNVDLAGPLGMTVNAASGAAVNFGTSQNIKSVSASGTVTLTAGGSKTLNTGSLSIPAGGTVDLTNNALSVTAANTPLSTVRGYLSSAYNNGAWNQPGLTSSTAAATNRAFGLAYTSNGTTVTVQYARMGDLTLDGKINGDDYVLIDKQVALNGFGSAAGWTTGDFNYDGTLTSADYLVMDIGFGRQQGTLDPAFLAGRQAEFGDAYVSQLVAAVPEPASLSLVGLGSLPLLARRRRTSR